MYQCVCGLKGPDVNGCILAVLIIAIYILSNSIY